MSSSRNIILIAFSLIVTLGMSLSLGHQPSSAQRAQPTPPAPATSTHKTWLSFLQPGEIIDLAVAGDDIWAATESSVIHWDRTSGDYMQYTSVDGLPEGQITELTLDPSGRPWVLMPYHGISTFDGQRWSMFSSLEETFNLTFVAQEPPAFWVATTYEGVSYFEGQPLPEHQATYTRTTGLSAETRTLLALDPAGQPWLGTGSGISHFDGQRWLAYTVEDGLPSAPVTSITFDPESRPWVGTEGGGLGRPVSTEAQRRWLTDTVEDGLASNWITAITFDAAGQPWVGTANGGVSYLEEGASRWTSFTVADGLAGHVVDTIVMDPAGQPWVVTRNDGVSTPGDHGWVTYPYPGDSSRNWVTATTVDEEGNLWIGQANGQVSQLVWPEQPGAVPQWVTYGTTGPADNAIQAALVDSLDRRWFGTKNKGVIMFDGQSWTNYTVEDGLIDNRVSTLAVDAAGALWVGTFQGLSHFDGQAWMAYTFDTEPYRNQVQAIAIDPAGHIWVGTPGGLHRFDGQSWSRYTTNDGLISDNVTALAVDPAGGLWIGTYEGVSHFIPDTAGGPTWMSYTAEDGLISNDVGAVAVDAAGNKWFGTSNGLSKFDGQNWTGYTAADGLAGDSASVLAVDRDGHLWVGRSFSGGVSEFDGQNWRIHSPTLAVEAIAPDPAGPIWFGTSLTGIRALIDTSRITAFPFTWEPVTAMPQALSFSPTEIPDQAPPLVANLPPEGFPQQPLQAWSVAPDGAVFGLDAANTLYQLDPRDLSPLAQSPPLFDTEAGDAPYLLADLNLIFVGNKALTETLVLDRIDFAEVARLPQAGPMAVDLLRQLVMIPQALDAPMAYTWEFWVYDLADLAQAPRRVQTGCTSGPPVTDPLHRRLYLQSRVCEASPPHQRDYYAIYDLDTLTRIGQTEPRDPDYLDRPSVAGQADFIMTVDHLASGPDQPVIFDLQGQELATGERGANFGHIPVIDAQGEWLYLVRARDLAVFRANDLSLQSLRPFTTTPPAGMALSPDAETLYLFGNSGMEALSTSELQALGTPPINPLPAAWLQEEGPSGETLPVYLYPSPTFEQDGSAFLELLQPRESYRTGDGGRSWVRLPTLNSPTASYGGFIPFSISPDFNRDRTLVTPRFRSADGGESWTVWSPPLAFSSDRDGNREIYTIAEASAQPQQLTDHPAADENPAWSPAWTYLTFQSDRNGNWDIFTLPADCQAGCEPQQLTDDPADEMLPAWSPDGRWIAFVSTRDGNPEIYVMDREGKQQHRLTFDEAGDWRPAWLPDSRHLLFTSSRNGSNDIYQLTVPPAGDPPLTSELELVPLVTDPSDDRDPAVGLDGNLFFLSDREGTMKTYTYRLNSYNGEIEIKVYTDNSRAEAHPSPWGHEALLVSAGEEGNTDIYQLRPYLDPVPLTTEPGFDGQPAGGPVWWQPDPEASREWLANHP